PLEAPRIFPDRVAQVLQRLLRRHPHPAARETTARRDLEIEPGATTRRLATHRTAAGAMVEPARGVRLVGRLVLGEANVAVNAEHRALRITDDLGREGREPDVHLLEHLAHRPD